MDAKLLRSRRSKAQKEKYLTAQTRKIRLHKGNVISIVRREPKDDPTQLPELLRMLDKTSAMIALIDGVKRLAKRSSKDAIWSREEA